MVHGDELGLTRSPLPEADACRGLNFEGTKVSVVEQSYRCNGEKGPLDYIFPLQKSF